MTITAEMRALLALSVELQRQPTLDGILQRLVERTAIMLGVEHASIRLLDTSRTMLLTHARAGDPFHQNVTYEFIMGEGLVGWVAKHGQPLRVADAELDDRFKPRPDQQRALRSLVAVPLIELGTCIGVLSAAHGEVDRFTADHEDLLLMIGGLCVPHVRNVRMSRLASPDPVTGAMSRSRFDEVYPRTEVEQAASVDPLAIALVDVDGFSALVGKYGKGFGEDLLKGVAEAISNVVRRNDAVVRFGDDEFLLLMPGVDLPTAARIGERIRRGIEADLIVNRPTVAKLTVCVAITERRRDEARDDLIARVSAALVVAKKKGENRVEVAHG